MLLRTHAMVDHSSRRIGPCPLASVNLRVEKDLDPEESPLRLAFDKEDVEVVSQVPQYIVVHKAAAAMHCCASVCPPDSLLAPI